MADLLRQASPRISSATGSPGPGRPSPLSRPHWPWSTYTHRSTSSSSMLSSSSAQSWDSRAAASSTILFSPSPSKRSSGISTIAYHNSLHEETTTRQWSFNAFEWVVRDVSKLRDFVEGPEAAEPPESDDMSGNPADDFEVLKDSPVIGDGKFKLEIAKTAIPENPEAPSVPVIKTQPQTLSLFITSLLVDYAHADFELSMSMFAAIKCQDDRAGERGARAEWAWDYWHEGWVFRQESEVWECPLPSLSSLLENPRIKETDSFVVCVQMHSPVGPFFPQQPAAYYVPRDLLDGLEASLDNSNTGDVRFICLERKDIRQELSDAVPSSPSTAMPMSPDSASSHSPSSNTIARKRIIYAHSDILTRRSEYFATMLGSAFSENVTGSLYPGDRKMYTVLVEEADFVTIYWLLKFVYANWVLFRKDDDPREAVDGIGAGWGARGFSTPGTPDEWDWKPLSKAVSPDALNMGGSSDTRSVTSAGSVVSSGGSKDKDPLHSTSAAPTSSTTTGARNAKAPSRPPVSPARRSTTNSGSSALTVPMANAPAQTGRGTKPVPVPISPSRANYASPSRHQLSPHQQRQRPAATPDPHQHPAPPAQPASALCMYQIAHRYAMPGLAALALEHILSTITPQSSFAVLLATAAWEELHALVEDYVVEKWGEVSVSEEFEQCCQEVAGGEWGPEGGKTLMAMFRRLRSPSAFPRA